MGCSRNGKTSAISVNQNHTSKAAKSLGYRSTSYIKKFCYLKEPLCPIYNSELFCICKTLHYNFYLLIKSEHQCKWYFRMHIAQ